MMKIKLTHEEVIQACAEYMDRNSKGLISYENAVESSIFYVFDQNDKMITYSAIEFECSEDIQ